MNFFSNRIPNPAGGGPTFEEWVQKLLKEAGADSKTASEAKPECEDGDPRGACRGQVINNDNEEGAHSYQEGESVDGKPDQVEGKGEKKEKDAAGEQNVVEADCGKDMGECDDAGKVTEDHTEAGPGDDENPEPKILINNDPNYQKGESTDPGKVKGDNKKETATGKKKDASSRAGFKKIAEMNRNEKLHTLATLTSNKSNLVGASPLSYCEAMVGLTYANLTSEEKKWFTNFWLTMYPREYVDEMVADR